MPTSKQTLSPTQIGYLRNAPTSDSIHRAVTGPLKGMLNKFSSMGLVDLDGDSRFRRTAEGDEAVAAFDEELSDYHRETLQMAVNGEKALHTRKGAMTLVRADLLYVRMSDGRMAINENGRRVVAATPSTSPKA